jgi:hypothetical protein
LVLEESLEFAHQRQEEHQRVLMLVSTAHCYCDGVRRHIARELQNEHVRSEKEKKAVEKLDKREILRININAII